MAKRNRITREAFDHHRGFVPMPVARAPLTRPLPPHPALLEEELEIRNIELHRLLGENRRFLEDRIVLDRELSAATDELRRLNAAIVDMRSDQEAQSRELIERGRKLEAELRAAEPLKSEAAQLQTAVQRLNGIKDELLGQLQSMSQEVEKLRADNDQIPVLRSEIEGLHQELLRARNSIDYEKSTSIRLTEQRQTLENNMVAVARDVEKLRSELVKSGSRTWSAGGSHAMTFGNLSSTFSSSHGSGYGIRQGAVDKTSSFPSGSASWGGYENSWLER
ncbi:hypothetical protein M569_03293, partial [Genlisea aurea]